MDYFKDLQFIRSASLPSRRSYHSGRTFDNYYAIHYCHTGEFSLQIDDGNTVVSSEPCAFLAFPGAKFAYGSAQKPYHHLYVCFRGPLAETWRTGGLLCCLKKDALIPIINQSDFFNKFERMISLLRGPERHRSHARAVLLLTELLLQMSEQQLLHCNRTNPFAQKMNNLAKAVHRTPEIKWDFAVEARKMKISYSYFRKLFEELYQEPPHHFLLQCRLQKAEYMLIDNDMPISEVAVYCGFNDEFYFSRLFKKYYGTSPLKYRKEHLSEL